MKVIGVARKLNRDGNPADPTMMCREFVIDAATYEEGRDQARLMVAAEPGWQLLHWVVSSHVGPELG